MFFYPVGWEETPAGAGPPQELINRDLERCDFAVFVLHDRWGTATGAHTSGTEAEWEKAEQLYNQKKILNIALFFKNIDEGRRRDPGSEVGKVLAFKARIERERRYLFKPYATTENFKELLENQLATWLEDIVRTLNPPSAGASTSHLSVSTDSPAAAESKRSDTRDFDFWIGQADRALEQRKYYGALFCAENASELVGSSDINWARATRLQGIARFYQNNLNESIATFSKIVERFDAATDPERLYWKALGLFNKAVALSQLGRREEAAAIYEDLAARFEPGSQLAMRKLIATALYYKGINLGRLGANEEAIKVYDDVAGRFGWATESTLHEQVAKALFSKALVLGELGRSEEAMAAYDSLIVRFGSAPEILLQELVAKALFNKGVILGQRGQDEEANKVYDSIVSRFGAAPEPSLQELVAKARAAK